MTTQRPKPARRSAVKLLLAAGVAVALLVYGITGVLVQMLGASHFHRTVAEAGVLVPLQDFRRQSVSTVGHEHGFSDHAHSAARRHGHDAFDPSLVTIGADEPADEGTSSGAACQMALLRDGVACAEPSAVAVRWPSVGTTFAFLDLDRIERPPRD